MVQPIRRLIAIVLAVALAVLWSTPVASATMPADDVSSTVEAALSSANVSEVLDEASAQQIERGRRHLAKAAAFVDLVQAVDQSGQLLDYFAVALTADVKNELARNVRGKHFELTLVGEQVQLALVDGAGPPVLDGLAGLSGGVTPMDAVYGYACWQAYAAAFAFALGMGMVCWPLGGFALACSAGAAVLFPINWNAACK